MTVDTLNKEAQRAIEHFESKLSFEWGPVGLYREIKEKKPVQILDLRTKELFEQAHIPGALHILYDDLDSQVSKLNKEIPTIVYCYDIVCNLSAKAALLLAKKGLNVKELVGGFDQWQKREFPVEGKSCTSSKSEHGVSSCSTSKESSCG